MKKSIFSLMLGAIVALMSCTKSDEMPHGLQESTRLATFAVEALSATRTPVSGLTRYIVEAYEGKNLAAEPMRVESATGSLTLALKKNTEYTFVFWADNGVPNANTSYWDAVKLQYVKVAKGKELTAGEVAYCLAVSFNSKDFDANKAIVLKNATAQVNFIEGAGLVTANNTLVVKYSAGTVLNVATGKIAEVTGEVTHTFTNIAQAAKDVTLATDYVLAPIGEQNVVNLKVQFNSETEKTIDNVPFAQNFKTNIKGEYSNYASFTFTVTSDGDWNSPGNGVEFQAKTKVSAYYYKVGENLSAEYSAFN